MKLFHFCNYFQLFWGSSDDLLQQHRDMIFWGAKLNRSHGDEGRRCYSHVFLTVLLNGEYSLKDLFTSKDCVNFTKPLLRDKTLRVVTFQRLHRRVVIQSAVMENGEGQTLAWLILNLVVMLPPVDRKENYTFKRSDFKLKSHKNTSGVWKRVKTPVTFSQSIRGRHTNS